MVGLTTAGSNHIKGDLEAVLNFWINNVFTHYLAYSLTGFFYGIFSLGYHDWVLNHFCLCSKMVYMDCWSLKLLRFHHTVFFTLQIHIKCILFIFISSLSRLNILFILFLQLFFSLNLLTFLIFDSILFFIQLIIKAFEFSPCLVG